jgi:hypothetical protein
MTSYITDLGPDAVWISPFPLQGGPFYGVYGYHGYCARTVWLGGGAAACLPVVCLRRRRFLCCFVIAGCSRPARHNRLHNFYTCIITHYHNPPLSPPQNQPPPPTHRQGPPTGTRSTPTLAPPAI